MKIFKKKSVKNLLAPETEFYETLLSLSWKPFIMFGNFSNIRSDYCNTDSSGLRYNYFDREKNYKNINNSIFDEKILSYKEKAVLIGNCTAFGWGATSDQTTISCLLTKKTKFHFYNLGVNACSGFQEIVLFLSLQKKLNDIKKIIILSGVNDAFLPYYIKDFDENLGPFFSYSAFLKRMHNPALNFKEKLQKFFYNKIIRKRINAQKMYELSFHKKNNNKNYLSFNYKKNLDPKTSLESLIDKNLNLWSIIGKGMGINISYALQPVANWCDKKNSIEEKKIFDESDLSDHNLHILSLIDLKKYDLIKNLLTKGCKKYDIQFMDCNESIGKKNIHKEWIFLDRFHLNDKGSRYISESLLPIV